MYILLALIGMLGAPIATIVTVVAKFRKKPAKKPAIAIGICLLSFIVAVAIAPPTEPQPQLEDDTGSATMVEESTELQEPAGSAEPQPSAEDTAKERIETVTLDASTAAKTATEDNLAQAYTYIHDNYTKADLDNSDETLLYMGVLMRIAYANNADMSKYYDVGCGAEQTASERIKGNPESDASKEGMRKIETAILGIDADRAAAEQAAAEQAAAEQAAAEQAAAEQAAAEQAAAERAAAEQAAAQQAAAEQAAAQQAQTNSVSADEGRTVYYTQTGKKYHYENPCGRGTYYPCTLAEAEAKGLTPCEKCVLH